ncbi:MotA/TolQ/ExbB proton channel family protein [Rhodospirillaceae bacterium]|nr:MotA/TolQ/ExbB proton channel family protein [Rhodospirillaceae bacterium]
MHFRYLLLTRFIVINTFLGALVLAAFGQGWLDTMISARLAELTLIIVAVFLYGLAACGWKIWRLTVELNGLAMESLPDDNPLTRYLDHVESSDSQSRALQAGTLRLELTDRIVSVRHIANTLIFLGLIGTVIGFIIALSAVDPNIAAEAENVASVIAMLIDGMSVALNTTLVGATLYLWLTVNYRVLTSGTVNLITEVVYTGERRASA